MKYPFDFYTQYCQFYLNDQESPRETDSKNFWTAEAYDDRLAIGNGILGVGTECYGPVKGELKVLEAENKDFNLNDYDHIVEGGLEISSGTLTILDCPNSAI